METLPSSASLHQQKRVLKREMQQWEIDYEEKNTGLVPTHYDKKESPRYSELKARARKIEAALVLSKAGTRAQRAKDEAEEVKAARALRFAGQFKLGNKELGHREDDWREEINMDGVGSMQNLFEETVQPPNCPLSLIARPLRRLRRWFHIQGSVSTYQVVTIAMLSAIPACIFCTFFSFMGFGSLNFAFLRCFVNFYRISAGFAVLIVLILYLFDSSHWASPALQLLRRILYSLVVLCFGLALMMASDDYPFVPLFLFLVLVPIFWRKLLKVFQVQRVATTTFLLALSMATAITCLIGIAAWVLWVLGGHEWSHSEPNDNIYFWMQNMRCCQSPPLLHDADNQLPPPAAPPPPLSTSDMISDASQCLADNVERINVLLAGGEQNRTHDPSCYVPAASEDRQVCLSVLLLWMTPFVIGVVGLFVAVLTYFLGKALHSDQQRRSNLGPAPRIFVFTVTIGVMGCWIAASIAGSNVQMSRVVMMGSLLIVFVLGLSLERLYGWRELLRMVMLGNNMMRKMMQWLITSDLIKAFVVWGMAPIFLLVLCLSAVNQWIRVHVRRQLMVDKERKMVVTKRAHDRLTRVRTWNWTVVLRNVVLIGAAYLILQVLVSNFLTVFLAWLIEFLASFSLVVVTSIFSCVGLIMFLLPPVPGTPVYLGAGLLLTSTAEVEWASKFDPGYLECGEVGLWFWAAAAYAAAVALVIKVCACAMQQKLLGENLRRSVAVRKFVGINSPFMKVMSLLLREKGCTMSKVAILVGGPDWPTSVTVGILGMPLLPILVGTLPVVTLIAPTSLYGSFLLVPEDAGAAYASLGKVLLAASAGTQLAALVAVGHYIEKATFKYAKELEKMKDDQEVVKLEDAEKEMELLYSEITHWRSSEVPKQMRIVLIAAAAVMILACYVVIMGSSYCFREFQIAVKPLNASYTQQVESNLDGSIYNLVELPGWAVIFLMCVSLCLDRTFARWAKKCVSVEAAKGRKPRQRVNLLRKGAVKQIANNKGGVFGLVKQAQMAQDDGMLMGAATEGPGGSGAINGLVAQLKAHEAVAGISGEPRAADPTRNGASLASTEGNTKQGEGDRELAC